MKYSLYLFLDIRTSNSIKRNCDESFYPNLFYLVHLIQPIFNQKLPQIAFKLFIYLIYSLVKSSIYVNWDIE